MFKLLSEGQQDKMLMCFGPFNEGKWVNNDIEVVLDELPPKVPSLVGR